MRVGFIAGAFDLLHAGHIHLLKQCKARCDILVVGLHVDPSRLRPSKNRPAETVFERQMKLSACKYIDKVAVYEYEQEIARIMKYFEVDIRFLGSDYKNTDKLITDKNAVRIEYIDSIDIHTSDIRKRILYDNN